MCSSMYLGKILNKKIFSDILTLFIWSIVFFSLI